MELRTDLKYWLEEWLTHGRPTISRNRLRADRSRVESYILPYLGRRSVTRLRRHNVEEWLSALSEDGVGLPTQHAALLCLRGAIQFAIDSNINIPENPAWGVTVQGLESIHQPTLDEIITDAQLTAILKCCDPHWRPMLLFAARTGAKWEECVGLRTSDIHLPQGMVTVGRTRASETADGIIYGEGTGTDVRLIEMTMDLADELRQYLDATKDWRSKEWDFVFLTKRDHRHPLRPNFNTFTWRPALRDAGLDERSFTFHDLRHTAAAHMIIEEGWSLEQVSRALGHTSVATTRRIYKNFFMEREAKQQKARKRSK